MSHQHYFPIEIRNEPLSILNFAEALNDCDLCYNSDSLKEIFSSDREMKLALMRTIQICKSLQLPLNKHFKKIYIVTHKNELLPKWKLSKIAYGLTMMNGDPNNEIVGKFQFELLNSKISQI